MVTTINSSNTQYDITMPNGEYILEAGATINSGFGHGINESTTQGNNKITVNGTINALSGGSGAIVGQGDGSDFIIGATGNVNGYFGVEMFGGSQSLVNSGHITALFRGVYIDDKNSSFSNFGTVGVGANPASTVDGVLADGTSKITNQKTGIIDVTGTAVNIASLTGENTTVTNYGKIAGDSFSFVGVLGNEKLINRGSMYGNISLGAGNDTYDGHLGKLSGTVSGGAGNDTYIVDATSVRLSEGSGGGTDHVKSYATYALKTNFENLTLLGSADIGGTGTSAANKITGNGGDNLLKGLQGNDVLTGGAGNDRIEGGAGIDKLTGGAGADDFILRAQDTSASKTSADIIYDFTTADDIDLHYIDANTKISGDQAFKFIGTHAFDGKAGELRFEKLASDTYVFGDVNGDKKADFAIHLDDAISLVTGHFIL